MFWDICKEIISGLILAFLTMLGIAMQKFLRRRYQTKKLQELYSVLEERLNALKNHEIVTHFQSEELDTIILELSTIVGLSKEKQFAEGIKKCQALLGKADQLELKALQDYQKSFQEKK